jgi:DeoR family transcriptional regulator of aga operon
VYDPAIPEVGQKRARRMSQIIELLASADGLASREIAAALGVSPATVRRDLAVLADHQVLARTHGGARLAGTPSEIPPRLRAQAEAAKTAIAKAAVHLLLPTPPPQSLVVGLLGGTTTAAVAQALAVRGHKGLRLVTNSLPIAQLVIPYPALRIVLAGGMLRPESLEMVGAITERTFNSVNIDVAVVGADGVTEAGITTHNETEARTNAALINRARKVVVVADGSKVGRTTMADMAGLDQIHTLITDQTADPRTLAAIRQAGVAVKQVHP